MTDEKHDFDTVADLYRMRDLDKQISETESYLNRLKQKKVQNEEKFKEKHGIDQEIKIAISFDEKGEIVYSETKAKKEESKDG